MASRSNETWQVRLPFRPGNNDTMAKITSAEKLNNHYATYEIEVGELATQAAPGQIVLAAIGESPLLPSPVISVSEEKQSLTILGLTHDAPGDTDPTSLPVALEGPFGGHVPDTASRVLCVAEGLGVGCLVSRLETYKARDAYTIVVAGYGSAAHMYWRDLLDGLSDELYIVTNDGSFGIKGPTRDTVKGICENVPDIERVVAIASITLLKACARISETAGLPLQVGLAAVADPNVHGGVVVEGAALREFDWTRSERDGHKTDFDEMIRKLGLQPTK